MSSKTVDQVKPRGPGLAGTRARKTERADLIDWNAIHNAIQLSLATMDQTILTASPGCRVEAGSSRGKNLLLFSYRLYRLDQKDADPVVVGISFEQIDSTIRAQGDISGEESGNVYFASETHALGHDSDGINDTARRMAFSLTSHPQSVLEGLLGQ